MLYLINTVFKFVIRWLKVRHYQHANKYNELSACSSNIYSVRNKATTLQTKSHISG